MEFLSNLLLDDYTDSVMAYEIGKAEEAKRILTILKGLENG